MLWLKDDIHSHWMTAASMIVVGVSALYSRSFGGPVTRYENGGWKAGEFRDRDVWIERIGNEAYQSRHTLNQIFHTK